MKTIVKVAIAFALALMLITPALAAEAAMNVYDVDYDDSVSPGDTVALDFTLSADKDVKEIKVTGQLQGVDDTKSELKLYKISANSQREHLSLKVAVPNDLKAGFYTITIDAEAKSSSGRVYAEQWTGSLEVEAGEHSLWIKNIVASADTVRAGNSFDVAVKLLNNGQNSEDGVRVKLEIPELDVSQTVKLTNTVFQEDEFTTYMTLNVPRDADAGIYTLKTTASNGDFSTTAKQMITVEEAPRAKTTVVATPIASKPQLPVLKFGVGNVVDLAISNNEDSARTFTLQVAGTGDWASSARVDPTTVTLEAGQSETVHVYLLPTQRGEQDFTLFVKSGSQVVSASNVRVKVDGLALPVIPTSTDNSNNLQLSTGGLVVMFVALVVIVAIGAGVWAWKRGPKGQIYY